MTVPVFDPVAFSTAVLGLLAGMSGVTVYDGEVPATPPADSEGRVNAYAVFYAGPGINTRNTLDATSTVKTWGFQVTAVGGDRQRCSYAVREVTKALTDQRLTVATWTVSPIEHIPGPDMNRDDHPNPPRFYVPLLFTLAATPA